MFGFNFLLFGWIVFDITLIDLFDLRYNQERTIKLIPGLDIYWSKIKNSFIITIALSWLNLELSATFLDVDCYLDKLEELLDEAEKMKVKENEKE